VSRTKLPGTAVAIVLLCLAAGTGCSSHPAASSAAAAGSTPAAAPTSPTGAAIPAASVASPTPSSPASKSSATPTPAPSSTPKPKSSSSPPNSPSATGWPDAATTGVKPGTHLVPKTGEILITQNGAVVQNLDLVGDIRVEADNVTIRNVRISAPQSSDIDQWGILQWVNHTGLTIEDSEIAGRSDTELRQAVMNDGGMVTVLRCNIHGMSKKGVYTSQGDIEDDYIHDPYYFAAADGEVDMIRVDGSPDPGTSLMIRHNALIDSTTTNSALSLFEADGGTPSRVTAEDNYMATNGWAIYAGGQTAATTDIVVKDNVFWTKFKDGYGYVTEWNPNGSGNVWSGNHWEDGRPAPLP
jgi:hypothetical protein